MTNSKYFIPVVLAAPRSNTQRKQQCGVLQQLPGLLLRVPPRLPIQRVGVYGMVQLERAREFSVDVEIEAIFFRGSLLACQNNKMGHPHDRY